MKTPAYAYDRVSTVKQETEGMSLEYQARHAQRYADENNLEIVKSYSSAESAFKEGRKNFNQMLDDAIKNNIKDLIFKNTDRLARNEIDWARCKKLTKEKGIRIHLYELNTIFDTSSSAEEEMFLDNTAAMAKYWSNKISKSLKRVWNDKRERGIRPSNCPTGYKYNKELQKHVIDPTTQGMIDYIFNEYDNNSISIERLLKLLAEKGYRSPKGLSWHRRSLHYILTNPFYAGKFYIGSELVEGTQDKYISWERYTVRLDRIGERWYPKRRDFDFEFANMLTTSHGNVYTGEYKDVGKGYRYYTYLDENGKRRRYKEDEIMKWIDSSVQEIQFTDNFSEFLKATFKNIITDLNRENSSVERSLNKRISDLKIKQDKVFLLLTDDFPVEVVRRQISILQDEIKKLEIQKVRASEVKEEIYYDIADAIERIKNFPAVYASVNTETKAEYLKSMSKKIVITPNGAAIKWREPFSWIIDTKKFSNGDKELIT